MTNRELEKHFKQEDEVFNKICMLQDTCNGCPYGELCLRMENEQVQKQKSNNRRNNLYEFEREQGICETKTPRKGRKDN